MQNIQLKIKAITPLHIGSGEVYEPTNFIIDKQKLYHFRDEDFFMALDEKAQKEFLKIAEDSSPNSFVDIHKFVKKHQEIAKKATFLVVNTTQGINQAYFNKVGKTVQIEGRGRNRNNVFNRFEIQRTQRKQIKLKDKYTFLPYIPGSSLKGSISTAYREFIYKKYGEKKVYELFENPRNMKDLVFKHFKVADSKILKYGAKIGYAVNRERFEDDEQGPVTIVESIVKGSEFLVDITIDDCLDKNKPCLNFEEIKKACNEHYLPIFKQMFESYAYFKGRNVDEYTNEYFSDEFYDTYKDFKLKPNQILLRVGKYSQARAVTIDGLRKIKVKVSGGGPKRKPNKWETLDQETTTWFFSEFERSVENLYPFGWVIAEIKD